MHRWHSTNAPLASWRTDDIWVFDANHVWAVNSNGDVLHTPDGGDTWKKQFTAPASTYLRCIGFANDQLGWVGTLDQDHRLFHTEDGGTHWVEVLNLPAQAPAGICGLSVVNERVVYGAGTNFPDVLAGVVKTINGGSSWTTSALSEQASLLVDVHFFDEQHGFVVGGKADVPNPTREDVWPVVLFTDDGGQTWVNRLASIQGSLIKGEWGWKIQFVDENVGFVSLESFTRAAILTTIDGGRTWQRKVVNDPQGNANLEGIGFLDSSLGWAGGWGDQFFIGGFTSQTLDGGSTWSSANHVGRFLNRFRFIREPELVGYACGDTVYKYSAYKYSAASAADTAFEGSGEPRPRDPVSRSSLPVRIPLPAGTSGAEGQVNIWDRFGRHLATLTPHKSSESANDRSVVWGGPFEPDVAGEVIIYRVTTGDETISRAMLVEPNAPDA